MIRGRVKITDIAKELGVSTSTVSRALSNEGRISAETREAVIKLAKDWGYKPNPFAINLLKKKSKNVGLILPEFTHHYFSKVLDGVSQVLSEHGYYLFINTHGGEIEKEVKAVNMLSSMRVDGIIASYARETSDFSHYLELIEEDVPLVFFDRLCEDLDTSYVVTDDFQGCRDAIKYLVDQGHRNIVHIQGPQNLSTSFNRYVGYKETLKDQGLTFSEELVIQSEYTSWKNQLKSLILADRVDAILCFNDYLAFDCVEIIKDMDLSVPEDISLIGFADEPIASHMTPRLSTINQPAELMGRKAAETLIWHIENPDLLEYRCESIPTELVLRDSTQKKCQVEQASYLQKVG
ncbi:MAG: LacI family DNA-binding transcriptional regulator [Bacteroidota bacterium]